MSNSNPTDSSEDERIKAWRAERARIAEADKAKRIQQKQDGMAQSVEAAQQTKTSAALTLLSSVRPAPTAQPDATSETLPGPSVASETSTKPGPLKRFGNWSLFFAMVVAPVLVVAFYLLVIATPLFEARSVIAITKSAESGNGARSGLLGGVQGPSNLSEVFRAHSYVQSQALMDKLETEMGLITEFSGPAIDPLKRLRSIPVLSVSKSAQFSRYVESSVDIQSGLLTFYVRAPSKEQTIAVSEAVLRYTEDQVLSLGQQVFDQRQAHVTSVRLAAEAQVAEAQAALVALQIKYQEVDPRNRIEGIYATIKNLEAEAQKLNSEVQRAEISGMADGQKTRQNIELEARIRQQIADQRASLVSPDGTTAGSLNSLLMEYELASLDLSLAREAVQASLKSQAEAGREAALNRSVFQVVVPPKTAQTAIYPKIPGTLALVFIILLALFSGLTMFRSAQT